MNKTKCVGDIYVSFGTWKTQSDVDSNITFCEYCVENGCVSDISLAPIEITGVCNCDCPQKEQHKLDNMCIQPFVCEPCRNEGIIGGCMMSKCKMMVNDKPCKTLTPSTANEYCKGCSALFHKCIYCGDPK
jgi:hypothetical protein